MTQPNRSRRTSPRTKAITYLESLERRLFLSTGYLDSAFASRGVADYSAKLTGGASAVLSGGKILVGGWKPEAVNSSIFDVDLTRLNSDGSIDTSFGTSGSAVTSLGASEQVLQMAIDPSGNIIVAGNMTPNGNFSTSSIFVARFHADGSLDSTFGTSGVTTISQGTRTEFPQLVLSGSKIIVAGNVGGAGQPILVRLNADGSFDSTFGSNGWASFPSVGQPVLGGIAVDSQGRILDYLADGSPQFFYLHRYTAAGVDDSSFGYVTLPISADSAKVVALADNSAVVAANNLTNLVLTKVTSAGQVDTTFGSHGVATFGNYRPEELTTDSSGRLVIAGEVQKPTSPAENSTFPFVARFIASGADTSFGNSGFLTFAASPTALEQTPESLEIQTDGKYVIGGNQGGSFVARVDPALSPPAATLTAKQSPASTREGSTTALTMTGSDSDTSAAIVSYEWDLNYNGSTFSADTTGLSATLPAGDGPATVQVAERLTDGFGRSQVTVTPVTILNVVPTAVFTNAGPCQLGNGCTVTFSQQFDPSAADTAAGFTYSYDFNIDGTYDLVTTSPTATVPASDLPAPGTYAVAARITDKDGGYSIYGTTITVIDPTTISGTAFGDSNANGVRDSGESGAAGIVVYLDANGNHTLDSGEATTTSDASGNYSFSNVAAGNYAVVPQLPAGWRETDSNSDITFGLTTASHISQMDFGLQGTPVSNLGGPYSVAEGASISLNAANSSEVGGSITKYEWDTNYNGTTFVARATGVTTSFSAVGLDGPSTRAIALRVTDANGVTAIATGSVSITDAPPTATFSNGGAVTQGSSGTVSFTSATDPSPADVSAGFKYSYDFNNDGTFDIVDSASSSATVASSYLSTAGAHVIKGRIKDKDGGFTDYTTTITVNAGTTGTITGTVFNDANGNGVKDSTETSGVSGQKFFLDLNRNSLLDSGEPTFTTGTNGVFTFGALAAGTYRVRMIQLTGWKWTAPTSGYYEVVVAAGQTATTKNYLEQKTAALAASPAVAIAAGTLSGTVFKDSNRNGQLDRGEAGLAGWVVYLDLNNNGKLDAGDLRFVTGADGKYRFVVPAGKYRVRQVLKGGWAGATPSAGLYAVSLESGQTVSGLNFGER